MKKEYLECGKVCSAHGVRGVLKIEVWCDSPKVLAKQNADTVVRFIAIPTKILTIILSPFVFIVMGLLFVLRKIWGKDHKDDDPTVTEEEIAPIIDTIEEEGLINEEQGELLQSTLDFRDTTVEKIMTPRIDMTALDIDADEAEKARVSPITYACATTPDTLLIAGTSDYHVLPRHSEKLFDKLNECGANTRLMYSIAGGHGFEPMHYGVEPQPGMDGVQQEIVKFILGRV